MSTRPGPLKPWPVDHFYPELVGVPTAETLLKTPSRPSNKRAHSGDDTPFSPTKRRLLNDAGILVPGKPSLRGTPARFALPLRGPSSPAKKLDFGTPKASASSAASRLAPSPRLSADDDDDSPFKVPSTMSPVDGATVTPPDLDKTHYPGFVVHEDRHPPRPSKKPRLSSGSVQADCKENDPPAGLVRETPVVFSTDPKTAELQRKYMLRGDSSPACAPVPVPETPKKKAVRKSAGGTASSKKARAQSVTPTEHRYITRAAKRRLLEAEADGAELY